MTIELKIGRSQSLSAGVNPARGSNAGGVGLTHYVAAKAGVIGMTKARALELAEHHILVNAIATGPILTPLIEGLSEQWKAAKQAELPLGRFGRAHEVAPTATAAGLLARRRRPLHRA